MADEIISEMLPLLREDDLTVKSFYAAHKDELGSENQARIELEKKYQAGRFVKVRCRNRGGGGVVIAYRMPEKR